MGKKILITGANKGIGFGIVKALLETAPEFDTIILTARNPDLGVAAIASLGNDPRLDFHVLDVTSLESITLARDYVASKYGLLDVLVNNAGFLTRCTTNVHLTIPSHLDINFFGLKHMTEAFLPIMQGNGHIVNISAALGKTRYLENPNLAEKLLNDSLSVNQLSDIAAELRSVGEDWAEKGWRLAESHAFSVYAHTKAFVNAYTRILAKEIKAKGSNVRINALHPGWVRTDMGGENATLSVEEGVATPLLVIRDISEITGKFWENGIYEEIS